MEEAPHRKQHSRDQFEPGFRLRVDDRIQVSLPEDDFSIFEPRPLFGKRAQGLGEEPEAAEEHGDLSPLRPGHGTGCFHNVADVHEPEVGVSQVTGHGIGRSQLVAANIQWNGPRLVLEISEP